MAKLLKDSDISSEIEKLIENADKYLLFISPYISLHQRIKDKLSYLSKMKPHVEIVLVFGKNEDDFSKSISRDDINFLKELATIEIRHEKRLHAKLFVSEDAVIATSMNLHQFSQNHNIEIGFKFFPNGWTNSGDDVHTDIYNFLEELIENAVLIYRKEAVFKKGMLGLMETYETSKTTVDEIENFFSHKEYKAIYNQGLVKHNFRNIKKETPKSEDTGYCIRTGKPIPFNPEKPLCAEAYKSWSIYKNPDFKEKYCHKTGQPSNGKTSMRNPILLF